MLLQQFQWLSSKRVTRLNTLKYLFFFYFHLLQAKLTNAEKQRRYREKIKTDAARNEEFKEKEKARNAKRRKISQMTPREQRIQRRKWKQCSMTHRAREAKKKEMSTATTSTNEEPSIDRINANKQLRYRLSKEQKRRKELENNLTAMKKQNQLLKLARDKYKKRSDRSNTNLFERLLKTPEDLLSPRSKALRTLQQLKDKRNEKLIAKKLTFHETLIQSVRERCEGAKRKEKKLLSTVYLSKLVHTYRLKSVASKTVGLAKSQRIILKEHVRQKKMKEKIEKFFLMSDVSRFSSGIKETITRKGIKMQRRYLLAPMNQLFEKFAKLPQHKKISYSTFTRYRPFYVCKPLCDTRDTCLCRQHVNIELKSKKLKKLSIIETDNPHILCEQIACDKRSADCMYGKCAECVDKKISPANVCDLDEETKWKKWDYVTEEREKMKANEKVKFSVKITSKIDVTGTKRKLLEELNSDLKLFKIHTFNIRNQNNAHSTARDNLNTEEALLHIDFSENYACKMSEEVQGFHFGASRQQCTLHTGVLYVKGEKPMSFCSISPSLDHGPEAIWAHLHPVLEWLKSNYPNISTLHFFSDGPASQYKQKKNFHLFSSKLFDYGFEAATWNFFESSHGKGAPDGVGGALKRIANMHVANGTDIPEPKVFYDLLKTHSKVKLFYVEQPAIDQIAASMPLDLKAICGTQKIHQLMTNKKHVFAHRLLSCFCSNNNWLTGKYCSCLFPCSEYTSNKATEKTSIYQSIYSDSSSSDSDSSSSEDEVFKDSGSSDLEDVIHSNTPDINKPILQEVVPSDIKQGVYILTEFLGGMRKKTKYRYVGVCQTDLDKDDGEVKVLFLKVCGEAGSLFRVDENDISYVEFEKILGILPPPSLVIKGDRVYYKFTSSIDVYEKA